MFDRVENRRLAKGLKYWAYSWSKSINWAKKILCRKICRTSFLKKQKVVVGQNECLSRSSLPKGSLKNVLWNILPNSQENIYAGIIKVLIQTVNYDTKPKAYVPIWARSVSYEKGKSLWNLNRFQRQSFADVL